MCCVWFYICCTLDFFYYYYLTGGRGGDKVTKRLALLYTPKLKVTMSVNFEGLSGELGTRISLYYILIHVHNKI